MIRTKVRAFPFAACVLGLVGCTAHGDVEATGSIWNEPAGKQSPAQALKATRDGLGDLEKGKKHYRERNFGLAEQHYRRATEKAPQDVEGWVGLAATYDQLGRFDFADRAYEQALILTGPTAEILNNQGYSHMLRGDYATARKKLVRARELDPENRYINANLELLDEM
jgi:Flp pilus assembly protein TadD